MTRSEPQPAATPVTARAVLEATTPLMPKER